METLTAKTDEWPTVTVPAADWNQIRNTNTPLTCLVEAMTAAFNDVLDKYPTQSNFFLMGEVYSAMVDHLRNASATADSPKGASTP
jgi:hypothetical protein